MPVTLARLREMLARPTGRPILRTTTGAGAAGGVTVEDTGIVRYDTNRLVNRWLLITSGTDAGESRRIASVSSTTITVTTTFPTDPTESGVTYEILAFDPDRYTDMLQEAARTVYPTLFKRIIDESIVVDNLLDNFSFESSESIGSITAFATYDSTVEGATLVTDAAHGLSTGDIITISGTTNYNGLWQVVVVSSSTFYIMTPFIADDGTGTWREGVSSQEGTASGWTATTGTWTFPARLRARHGRHTALSGGAGTLTQNIFTKVNVTDMVGKTLRIRGFIFDTTTDNSRLRVSFDGGTTFEDSTPFHGGDDEWEGPNVQGVGVVIPAGATTMTIYCSTVSGASFDVVTASIDPISQYPIPLAFVDGPHMIFQQADEQHPDGDFEPLVWGKAHRILRMVGMGYLTVPTGDTGVVELPEQRAELLVAQAAVYLYDVLQQEDAGNRDAHQQAMARWARRLDDLQRKPGIRMHPLGSHSHDTWGFLPGEGEQRMLSLKGR